MPNKTKLISCDLSINVLFVAKVCYEAMRCNILVKVPNWNELDVESRANCLLDVIDRINGGTTDNNLMDAIVDVFKSDFNDEPLDKDLLNQLMNVRMEASEVQEVEFSDELKDRPNNDE